MATGRLRAFEFQECIAANEHPLTPPMSNNTVLEDGAVAVQL